MINLPDNEVLYVIALIKSRIPLIYFERLSTMNDSENKYGLH